MLHETDIIENEIDLFIYQISPKAVTNKRRNDVFEFLDDILRRSIPNCKSILSGSFPLRSYLPESDMDIVLLTSRRDAQDDSEPILTIFTALCQAVVMSSKTGRLFPDMTIRNIEFVNARTRLAHCVVNNLSVDITVNQTGALSTAAFLEECDRVIGGNHMFKRSLLLIKAWCLHESARYGGTSILGSKGGMLSSYALSVLILYLFNIHGIGTGHSHSTGSASNTLLHPLSVLKAFLSTFSKFPWDCIAVSLEGPVSIINGCLATITYSPVNHFRSILEKYRHHHHQHQHQHQHSHDSTDDRAIGRGGWGPGLGPVARFHLRVCNIIDPIDPTNNLGMPITRPNLALIDYTLKCATKDFFEMTSTLTSASSSTPSKRMATVMSSSTDGGLGSNRRSNPHHSSSSSLSSQSLVCNGSSTTLHGNAIGGIPNGAVAATNMLPAAVVVAAASQRIQSDFTFVKAYFPRCFSLYLSEGSVRADMLDHPLQQGLIGDHSMWTHAASSVATDTDTDCRDPFLGDLETMQQSLIGSSNEWPAQPFCPSWSGHNRIAAASPITSSSSSSPDRLHHGAESQSPSTTTMTMTMTMTTTSSISNNGLESSNITDINSIGDIIGPGSINLSQSSRLRSQSEGWSHHRQPVALPVTSTSTSLNSSHIDSNGVGRGGTGTGTGSGQYSHPVVGGCGDGIHFPLCEETRSEPHLSDEQIIEGSPNSCNVTTNIPAEGSPMTSPMTPLTSLPFLPTSISSTAYIETSSNSCDDNDNKTENDSAVLVLECSHLPSRGRREDDSGVDSGIGNGPDRKSSTTDSQAKSRTSSESSMSSSSSSSSERSSAVTMHDKLPAAGIGTTMAMATTTAMTRNVSDRDRKKARKTKPSAALSINKDKIKVMETAAVALAVAAVTAKDTSCNTPLSEKDFTSSVQRKRIPVLSTKSQSQSQLQSQRHNRKESDKIHAIGNPTDKSPLVWQWRVSMPRGPLMMTLMLLAPVIIAVLGWLWSSHYLLLDFHLQRAFHLGSHKNGNRQQHHVAQSSRTLVHS
eukprot:gene150-252_t